MNKTDWLEMECMFDDLFDDKDCQTKEEVYKFMERLIETVQIAAQDYIDSNNLDPEEDEE